MPKLIVNTGERAGEELRISAAEVSIGRDGSNNIVVPDQQVSRTHARISWTSDGYMIEDLGSTNGTFVNNDKVAHKVLKFGDEIRLGKISLTFMSDSALERAEGAENISRVTIGEAGQILDGLTVQFSVKPDQVKPVTAEEVKADPAKLTSAYERLNILYKVNYSIGTVEDMPTVLDKILALVLDITKADRGYILLLDKETKEPLPQVVHKTKSGSKSSAEIAISRTIIDQVVKRGEALLISDAQDKKNMQVSESIIFHQIRSAMCVPIKHKDEILGILNVDTKSATKAFTQEDLELLSVVSREVGLAIANAQLFDDLKRAYEELKNRQAALVEAEKIAALGALAGGIVHEINNPLTSVISYSELIGKNLEAGKLAEENIKNYIKYAGVINKEGQRCHKIAKDLLHLARKKKAETAPNSVNDIAEAALEVARYHMSKNAIEVIKHLGEDIPKVLVDPNQIQQVFLNMIINAKDSMLEHGGSLTITTKLTDGKWVDTLFTDTGHGIPDDIKQKIFQALFTTKGEGKGTGLGLSVSSDIVANHGGQILLDSQVGKGTTFTIRLPIGEGN
ncbi:MAG: FHA domain-containing protein [Candidatus Omnitrophica bacterium]|nr:FHA domain-containing protein [Candidatus Omnitrophota bacterium]